MPPTTVHLSYLSAGITRPYFFHDELQTQARHLLAEPGNAEFAMPPKKRAAQAPVEVMPPPETEAPETVRLVS